MSPRETTAPRSLAPRGRRSLLGLAPLLLLGACGRGDRGGSQASASAHGARSPRRIVTVGGAVTETVFALGAGAEVVGVDTSSTYPEAATKLPQVGYQRTLSAEGVIALRPTHVLLSPDAGPPAAIEQLRSAGLSVEVMAGAPAPEGARQRIRSVALALGPPASPAALLDALDQGLGRVAARVASQSGKPRVLALYARGPNLVLVSGSHTPADAMLRLVGAENAAAAIEGSKPLTSEAVVAASPGILLIPAHALESLGGVDGLLAQPGIAATPAGRSRRVIALDDLFLLGFGPRTADAALALLDQLHPAGTR
jgi:iron complex transport system substrate-binding protein